LSLYRQGARRAGPLRPDDNYPSRKHPWCARYRGRSKSHVHPHCAPDQRRSHDGPEQSAAARARRRVHPVPADRGHTEPDVEINDATPVQDTVEFSYTNANWKDQLTAVNGTSITYDNIGNPTDDGIWEYEWEKGRQLKKMVKTGEIVEFKYNENGLRIQKVATSTGSMWSYCFLRGSSTWRRMVSRLMALIKRSSMPARSILAGIRSTPSSWC